MAITLADIKKLREMTSAGMMDCKNALTEADVLSRSFAKKVSPHLPSAVTTKPRKVRS